MYMYMCMYMCMYIYILPIDKWHLEATLSWYGLLSLPFLLGLVMGSWVPRRAKIPRPFFKHVYIILIINN